ncbi:hypothetical protein D3C76_1504060 [compost metagenome]
MHDEQPLRMGEGGADHTDPQHWQRGGDALTDCDSNRIRPGILQAKAQRCPQYRQRQGHQDRPKYGTQRQQEFILRDLAHSAAGPCQERMVMLTRTDAENHQQHRTKQRDQGFPASDHHHEGAAELRQGIQ